MGTADRRRMARQNGMILTPTGDIRAFGIQISHWVTADGSAGPSGKQEFPPSRDASHLLR